MITIFPLKGDIGVNAEHTNQLLMMSNTLKCANFGILVGYMTGEVNLFSVDGFISKLFIIFYIFIGQIAKFDSEVVAINYHSIGIIIGTAINGIHIVKKLTYFHYIVQ